MNNLKSVDFDIQRFADEAANETEDVKEEIPTETVDTDNASGEEDVQFTDGTTNVEESDEDEEEVKRKTTKAFSERLKQEKKLLEQQIREEKDRESNEKLDKIAKSRGFDSWKELEEYDKKEKLQTMGITDPDTFNTVLEEAISNNPIVQEAKQVLESQKQKEQDAIITEAITEISKVDPDIKSIKDLIALDNYEEFYALVQKGYSLPDAYKIFAFDKITGKKADSAAQNAIRNIDSKGHLKTVSGNKTNEAIVPDEILAFYKKNMPDMSDEDIRKHYDGFLNSAK